MEAAERKLKECSAETSMNFSFAQVLLKFKQRGCSLSVFATKLVSACAAMGTKMFVMHMTSLTLVLLLSFTSFKGRVKAVGEYIFPF